MTQRLFLEDAFRAHCLATVAGTRGRAVVLDRSVLYGASRAYGHEQPGDRGHLLAEGRKIKVSRALERDGELVHLLENDPPARGAKVQVHLDLPRRVLASRAHTLAHLVAHAARADAKRGAPWRLAAAPRLVGGGGVRVRLATPPEGLVARLEAAVAANAEVRARWVAAEEAPPSEPWPTPRGAGTLRVVEVEGVGATPCDGTHVRRSSEVGTFTARARPARDGAWDVEFQVR